MVLELPNITPYKKVTTYVTRGTQLPRYPFWPFRSLIIPRYSRSRIDPRPSSTISSFKINLANLESSYSELKWQPPVYEDYAKQRPPLYESICNLPLDPHHKSIVPRLEDTDVTTIDKNSDIFSSFLSETTNSKTSQRQGTDMELLFDLLEELPFQSVPGSEVMPNTTVSRQPLASTSSFASEDSYLSDSSINAGAGTGNILLDQFADINLLLAQQNQVNAQPLSALPVLSVDGVGCQGTIVHSITMKCGILTTTLVVQPRWWLHRWTPVTVPGVCGYGEISFPGPSS
ncbi:hypothetical protein BSL78_02831 [Apostichopus japonicus]|uniref:Uncharacterized protein n=1 Tax=Stichopus japonicus TaxID=307972 RepID=A0A2G8LIX5_STIJA|nr:hypothetical protein BSL78_02831 [Apostichopus japonicus]